MDTVVGLAIVSFAIKLMDLVKYLFNIRNPDPKERAGAINGTVTQLAAFLVGVLATLLVGMTTFANNDIFGLNLAEQGFWGQVVIGLLIASAGSFSKDVVKAVNPNDSSTGAPALLGGVMNLPSAKTESVPITSLEVTAPKETLDG
jgi:hypothetical protein